MYGSRMLVVSPRDVKEIQNTVNTKLNVRAVAHPVIGALLRFHMSTDTSLTPEWQPIALPRECAPYPLEIFPSTANDALGVVIAGGPAKLCVFQAPIRTSALNKP
jgi:hypothetical protein